MAVTQRSCPARNGLAKISRRQPSRRGTSAPPGDERITAAGQCFLHLRTVPVQASTRLFSCSLSSNVKFGEAPKSQPSDEESLISLHLDLSRRSSPKQGQHGDAPDAQLEKPNSTINKRVPCQSWIPKDLATSVTVSSNMLWAIPPTRDTTIPPTAKTSLGSQGHCFLSPSLLTFFITDSHRVESIFVKCINSMLMPVCLSISVPTSSLKKNPNHRAGLMPFLHSPAPPAGKFMPRKAQQKSTKTNE